MGDYWQTSVKNIPLWKMLAVIVAFIPPYCTIGLAMYWYAFDRTSPLTVVYQHPRFLSRMVDTREQAKAAEITEASAESPVWIWRELCLKKGSPPGISSVIWMEMKDNTPLAFAWSAPQRAFHEREGCYGRSFGPAIIPSAVGKVMDYHLSVSYDNNPLSTVRTVFPPIRVRILP
jgi:hypothetical protein